ncbi:MAG: hypothetical protein E7316_04845 [Clostridiales bacterium]|nr:hypothetical protein [Clostridiales bacterium]
MKKSAAFLLILLLLCLACTAGALEINLDSMPLSALYELYAQVESQLQLNGLEDAAAYGEVGSYADYERNPGTHKGEKIRFTGTVAQVSEGKNGSVAYRIAKDDDASQMFYVQYVRPEGVSRLLENDEVEVYAVFSELKTYTSTTKKSVTVPYCKAELIVQPVRKTSVSQAEDGDLQETLEKITARVDEMSQPDAEGDVRLFSDNYGDYARNASRHQDEPITCTGSVVQVTQGEDYSIMRLAVDGDSDQILYTVYDAEAQEIRVLENDKVTIRGVSSGLHTYTSALGGEISVPSCMASSVKVNGYNVPTLFPQDQEGYFYINSKTFGDYSRRPGDHTGEKVCFTGEVLQVVEGNAGSQYRVALAGESDQVIYVTLPAAGKGVRVLEDDEVTVYGAFSGLMTYESTMNVSVTIPACTAERIEVKGYESNGAQKDAAGRYEVTAYNYEDFARDESAYMLELITFEATVVQVVDGDDYTQYRMAIDGDGDCMFLTQIDNDDLTIRLLENDEITATGLYCGLYSYKSTRGGKITIPSCLISEYTLKGYTAAEQPTADAEGYYWITSANYEEYARNANDHLYEKIRFAGEVLQVAERSNRENVYRIAVDSDYDCAFYVEYTLPQDAPRILEDDVVVLSGTYYGLFSYSTTIGTKVTIPAAIAEDIGESYKPLKQGSSGSDVLQMKKRLQELGYFAEGAAMTNKYNATTVERVKLFQKVNGLKQTGTADSATLTLLYSGGAKPNPD